jgi:precorrin-6A/cobalt-precorrin-6A reductase
MSRPRILILGGSTEASALARALAADAHFDAELSLAGRTRSPVLPPIPHRIGGFGGIDGLAAYLRAGAFASLINATHPFAARMSANAVAAAARAGVPMLRVRRPEWTPAPDDDWTIVADMDEAAAALGETPRRVLLTIGQKDLAAFRTAPQHIYVIRSVDPPPPETRPPHAHILTARGPFDEAGERALLAGHRIEVVVTKNSGGNATEAKLVAARALRIPVVMVARPVEPPAETVEDAEAALAWLAAHHAGTFPPRGA